MNVLTFEYDDRADPDDARRIQFFVGFRLALAGRAYTADTLRKLTWNNLGWRLGRIYGAGGESLVDELSSRAVGQYVASGKGRSHAS